MRKYHTKINSNVNLYLVNGIFQKGEDCPETLVIILIKKYIVYNLIKGNYCLLSYNIEGNKFHEFN